MKHYSISFFTTLLLVSSQILLSEMDLDSLGSETLVPPSALKKWEISAYGDSVGKSTLKKKHSDSDENSPLFKDQSMCYTQASAFASYFWISEPCYEEAVRFSLGYSLEHYGWRTNPYFDQQDFNNLNVAIGFTTGRLEDWLWQIEGTANINTDNFQIRRYSSYDLLFWGRNNYCKDIGIHIGFYTQVGMKVDRFYPIIGFDWAISNKWQLNLVFPVNISCVYSFNDCWAVSLAGRYFTSRNRAGEDEPCPRAIVQYRNTGIELALDYELKNCLTVNLHAGTTLGGEMVISNQDHEEKEHFNVRPAGYYGGEIAWRF